MAGSLRATVKTGHQSHKRATRTADGDEHLKKHLRSRMEKIMAAVFASSHPKDLKLALVDKVCSISQVRRRNKSNRLARERKLHVRAVYLVTQRRTKRACTSTFPEQVEALLNQVLLSRCKPWYWTRHKACGDLHSFGLRLLRRIAMLKAESLS